MNKSNHLFLLITLMMGAATTCPAPICPTCISFTGVSDTATPIPGGTGTFLNFLGAPSLSAGNVAFVATGSGDQAGVYVSNPGAPIVPVADTGTAIPGGVGNFVSWPPSPIISGENVVFVGNGSGGQAGVYALYPPSPIIPVADTSTAIPGGVGNFVSYPPVPAISGENVAFIGTGSGGQVGVYVLHPPGPIMPVADTSTAIPGGVGTFVSWPPGPLISGETVAFIGSGSGGQIGVYVLHPPVPILPVADTSTAIPGGLAAFQYFTTLAMDSANNVAFVGGRAGNVDINPQQGVYKLLNGSLLKVADLTTAIPGATDNFSGFGSVAIDPGIVVFEGFDSDFRKGLYTDLGGSLSKVIAEGDTLGGKTVSALRFQHTGFSGGQAAFVAEFSDASQSVFVATLSQAPCPQS